MKSSRLFSRSPRTGQDSSLHSHSNSQSSSSTLPATSVPASSARATELRSELRRGQSLSVEMRGIRRLEQRRGMEENHYLTCRARANNYNPPVDLRMLEYVSTYDSNLMCPICRCPFVDPVALTECDHCFCRDCIRQTWNANTPSAYNPLGPRGDCPSCRTPAKLGPKSATNKILVNLVDELIVKCPKSDEGCQAEVKRGEAQDHVNIYCSYALVECTEPGCGLPVRRKDSGRGCLHYGVSCLWCRKEMQKWRLEMHWQHECSERKIYCELCKDTVYYRDLEEHNRTACPAISIPCPGAELGCTNRGTRSHAQVHAKGCALAKLAPILSKQQERLDEQEAAQKQMSRKLDVLESGFTAMQNILYPSSTGLDSDATSADEGHLTRDQQSRSTTDAEPLISPSDLDFPTHLPIIDSVQSTRSSIPTSPTRLPPAGPAPDAPGPRPIDLPEPLSSDFDLDSQVDIPPPDMNGGPYASPLHHLLSMHESLRDEMSRVTAALSELDGRHSMQNLNENLRTREEISYLGAQVAGLQRQVHWLTSTQLQRQQMGVGRSPTPGAVAGSSTGLSDAEAGSSMEAAVSAVSTAATALRGAARMVNVGAREGLRRGPSEEGRTKL